VANPGRRRDLAGFDAGAEAACPDRNSGKQYDHAAYAEHGRDARQEDGGKDRDDV
jgi:hypothetical protein